MPSPFPGMDPFLEDSEIFPDFHDMTIVHLKETIIRGLPPDYYAFVGNRIWVEKAKRFLGPDVRIHQHNGGPPMKPAAADGGIGTLSQTRAIPVVVTIPLDEIKETFVDIFKKTDEGKKLVTSIEILSPTNKAQGEHGREQYLKKQRQLHSDQVNLVEIDLLRGGKHATAVPLEEALEATGGFDYHVCCRRWDCPDSFYVYPILLENPLPVLGIPLLREHPDLELNLQTLFDKVYDSAQYPRVLHYEKPVPAPSLSPEKEAWLKKRLKEKGFELEY
jgi:hypothetical protein